MKCGVFVVDDSIDVRETVAAVLDLAGYSVRTAGGGVEALSAIEHGYRPNLVLLDLMMPDLNGFEVLGKIRASPELGSIPVVIVTAFPMMASEFDARGLSVQGLLEKPFDVDHLLETAQRICGPEV